MSYIPSRAGLDAMLMRQVVYMGLDSEYRYTVCSFSMVLFSLLFQCRSVTVANVWATDVKLTEVMVIRVWLSYRKSKLSSMLLILSYDPNQAWESGTGLHLLMVKWEAMRPDVFGFFNLRAQYRVGVASLGTALRFVLDKYRISPPIKCNSPSAPRRSHHKPLNI